VAGFKAGQKYTVIGNTPNGGVMLDNLRVLPLDLAQKFNVFQRQEKETEICIGDSIRITANGKSVGNPKSQVAAAKPHALNNGAVYKVKGFKNNGDIVLENGWIVARDFEHFTHGYCTTSHASQGKTVDRVFIAQSANSFAATSAEQFYVSVSRGRLECVIYTDDAEGLRQRINQTTQARFAVQLSKSRHEAEQRERQAVELARQEEERKASQWRQFKGPEKSRWKEERGYEHG
jgi:ATP-dependent exoDNAse (exonuclease V) alpha subunit